MGFNLIKLRNKADIRLLAVISIYFLIGLFLLKNFLYQINPDGVDYIIIAESYFLGNFSDAINSYWSPLLSWLLVPFLFFGQTPLNEILYSKIISLTVGCITLIGLRYLSYRFEMNEIIRTVLLLTSIPIILSLALGIITPDLLTVCILVFYLYFIFDPDYYKSYNNAIYCGILGAIAYFSKSFVFPFFLIHFLVFNIFHYLPLAKNQRKCVIKNFILGIFVFLIISGVWVAVISEKENKLTFGTSGEVNYALIGPLSNGPVHLFKGFDKPGNTVVNPKWSPFDSWPNLKLQLEITWHNFLNELSTYQLFSFFSITILLIYFLLCFKPFKTLIKDRNILYPVTTVTLLSAIYLPVLVEVRYLWLVYVLLLLMAGFLIHKVFETKLINEVGKIILLLIVAASFAYMPVSFLIQDININKDLYYSSLELKDQYNIQGNVASNDQFDTTKLMSFYMDTKYYGEAQTNITDTELKNDLKELKIDYYFVWKDSLNNSQLLNSPISQGVYEGRNNISDNSQLLSQYMEVTQGKIKDLKIYAVER